MINQPSQFPQAPKRSLFSARRIALMASVVAGLGVAGYGFDHASRFDAVTSAQAQVSANIGKAAQPIGFADIVQRVKPSVMSVKVTMREKADDVSDRGEPHHGIMAQGSGFFISPDGYAVTNNHVVEDATKVEVTLDDGKTYPAKVIGTDKRTDLALIKVEGGTDFPFTRLADGKARIGDWVLAVGNPFGLGGTVTAGIISANGRDIGSGPYDNYIQIDAPVNKGNSGGPSFNMQGEVVGVNTAIYSPGGGGSVGIAFAIPASTVKTVVAQLKATGSVSRGWLGVAIQPVTQDIADSLGLKTAEGALVAEPQDNSPAAKAGIASGDVITAVNGETVKDAHELSRTIGGLAPGDSVKLALQHEGREKDVTVTLGKLPNTDQASAEDSNEDVAPRLGLTIAPAASVEGAGRSGVAVTGVDPDGVAAARGLKQGDVILEVAGKRVVNPDDVAQAVKAAQAEKRPSVLMRIRSSDGSHYVALPFANG
ncbi:MAG: putative serine protease do-like precursor [Tardiphaga sp.]|nr:putative serine protease do-like precursor [Tardiphaga sp.]